MSTPNFHKRLAKNYYVIEGYNYQYYDEETQDFVDSGEFDPESIDNELEYVSEYAEREGWEACSKGQRMTSSRYDGYELAEKTTTKTILNGKLDINVTVELSYQSGHYTGANLDYDIVVSLEHPHYYEGTGKYRLSDYGSMAYFFGDLMGDFEDTCACDGIDGLSVGLAKMQRKNIAKKVASLIEDCQDEAEALCKKCSTTYYCTGIYSNGEATYCKA